MGPVAWADSEADARIREERRRTVGGAGEDGWGCRGRGWEGGEYEVGWESVAGEGRGRPGVEERGRADSAWDPLPSGEAATGGGVERKGAGMREKKGVC